MKKIWTNDTPKFLSQEIQLFGWVHSRRDHGKVIFFDLRDRSGIVQVVVNESQKAKGESQKSLFEIVKELRPEWVVRIKGTVQKRPEKLVNPNIPTGAIEVQATEIEILAKAETPPFLIETDGWNVNEELRMKYRYLDLRRERLRKNLQMRHTVILFMRNWLAERGFLEIETPMLTKSTPEGARDYLVPSRTEPGKFFALPQSPQQYKQLLMVAGIERYFQIARCFRDEDPRGDRQPEFTQLDLEMSFVEQEDVLQLIEELYAAIVEQLFPEKHIAQKPFPRLSYQEVVEKYQSDKPDLRKNKNDPNELAFLFVVDFPMFEWKENDPSTSSGQNRGRWDAMHHPFTQPRLRKGKSQIPSSESQKELIIELLKTNPGELLSYQHDFVCNGYEIGGGSIRTTDPEILQATFEAMGNSSEEVKQRFGHLLEAFSYGVPPHGGIAPGIDRFLMIVQNEPSIREVIAFPKTGEGRDLMMNAPSEVSKEQLEELKLDY